MTFPSRLRRGWLVACLLTAATRPAAAQVAVGDSLWQLGRTDEAVLAYRRALAEDRNSVRANFRVAQTLAWSKNIDSALVLLRAARERVPDDPDLLLTEATYLSWAQRYTESIARYDSLITAHPGNDFRHARVARARVLSWAGKFAESESGYRDVLTMDPTDRDARFGVAQVRAWSGDLVSSAKGFEALLAEDPTEVRTLVALGNLRVWQGRLESARALAERAAARDSADADVRTLRTNIAAQAAPKAEASQFWSEDSEKNRNQWQVASWRQIVADGLRAGATAGFLTATDPNRTARRAMAEVSLSVPTPGGSLTAVAGARAITPAVFNVGDTAVPPSRTAVTGRLTLQQRLGSRLNLAATVSRWPFDEIASITPLALDITQWDANLDWRALGPLTINGTLSGLSYSDGNQRRNWAVRTAYRATTGITLGAFASGFGFERRAPRYWSPPAFAAAEATVQYVREGARWTVAASGGYGAQRVDTLDVQAQWHADARVGRRVGANWTVELFAARSNSAAASAVGAYEYATGGLTVRRSF